MAYIRQRGDKWSFTVEAGTDPITGKRKQITRSGFKSEKEALREALNLEESLEKGLFNQVPKLRDFMDQFFDHVKNQVTQGTYDQQKHIADKYITPRLGRFQMDKITYIQVENFYNTLLNEKVSRGTIRNIALVLRKTFNTAEKWQIIYNNIMRYVKPPAYRPSKMTVWSKKEVDFFLKESIHSRQHTLYVLALSTGMRMGELLGLYWDDIDLENGMVQIERSLKYTASLGLHVKKPKNKSSERVISLPDFAIDALKKHKENSLPSKYVFHNIGEPIYPSEASRYFRSDQEKLGMTIIRFHDLRHTHATLLLLMGINPKVVAERLGHSSVTTTLDTYSHVMPSMQKDVADKMNALLSVDNSEKTVKKDP